MNLCPLQWEHGVLTTGPPGNSLEIFVCKFKASKKDAITTKEQGGPPKRSQETATEEVEGDPEESALSLWPLALMQSFSILWHVRCYWEKEIDSSLTPEDLILSLSL